jgi:protein gp37
VGADSKIEWTHHTFNPWRGCTKISQGCEHCYALDLSKRNPSVLGVWGPKGTRVVAAENYWRQPLKWNRDAVAAGERHRVFCASLADVFEGEETMPGASVDTVEAARERLWNLIEATPALDWLLLTKRPRNVMHLVPETWRDAFPFNVWLGTSVEDQAAADERIPHLLRVPARVRFLSCEPLLGQVDLSRWARAGGELLDWTPDGDAPPGDYNRTLQQWETRPDNGGISWVIVGGESGPNARPMHPEWARSLRGQCQAANVAFYFKQWGEWVGGSGEKQMYVSLENGQHRAGGVTTHDWGQGYVSERVGKKAAGRLLDGREWNEFPE